jgi:CYTH domain-containing protein
VNVHEAATQVITSEFNPRSPHFQEVVLKKTLADEALALEAIDAYGLVNPVLICDRGIPDQLGYIREKTAYLTLLQKYQLDEVSARDERYDAAIFLRSAAVGAEAFYDLESNKSRYENLEEAKELDEWTLRAWYGMPHLRIIENKPLKSFEDKMQATLRSLARILGVPEPLEQECKFRIDEFDSASIPQEANQSEIVQTYLVSKHETAERVRARGGSGSGWVFTHTIKEPRGTGVSIERERMITRAEYDNLLVRADTRCEPIHKTRWCFSHEGHYCELDIFSGSHEGLVMLEIEHDGDTQFLEPPQFLGKVTDVTADKSYSNYALAKAA